MTILHCSAHQKPTWSYSNRNEPQDCTDIHSFNASD